MTTEHLSSQRPVLPGEHLERLRADLHGTLVLPGDADWDAARQAWQLLADQHPTAVVLAADEHDVIATITAARKLGLSVAPQGTGHAGNTIASLEDTILLRTGAMDTVEIDPVGRTARVGAGATWGAVANAAAEHGLAAVTGLAGTVGVVGFSLGGGLGWLARSHGLGANSILAFDAVDAHGRAVHVDADQHADLFWAARGGIAPVVVTAIELRLYPLPEIWAGSLMWPLERAADVVHAWRDWIQDLPETVTSLARVLRYPPIPELPDFLRGRAFVAVEAALQADPDTVAALLQPLRNLAPEIDTVHPMSPAELATVHGDPPQPSGAEGASVLLEELDVDTVDAFLDAALAPVAAPLVSIEVRHLGGMLTPGRAEGGAVSSVDGEGLVYAIGIVPFPEALEPVRTATAAVADRLDPYATGRRVKNFCETPVPARELFGAATDRIRAVAASWDPEGVIRLGHPLD
ncbi:FAD-binding oxidoreductase [Microbacterium sp. GXF7504]